MNTFVYDSSPLTINTYTVVDLGSIGDAPSSTIDNGLAADDFVVDAGTDYIVTGDLVVYTESAESYGEINFTETTYPFGKINIGGGEGESATIIFIAKPDPIVLYEKAIVVRKQAWTGSGTLFEIANGLERKVAPYIGGSGPLRLSGAAVISAADAYNESSIQAYSADTNYGDLGTVGSSVDYGQVDQGSTNEFTYGDITVGDELRPFGSFRWSGDATTRYLNVYTKIGSGSLFGISGTTVVVAQTDDTFGLFKVFNSTIPDAFSRPYGGSGSLFSIFSNKESRVYRYSSESVVSPDVAQNDYGSGLGTVTGSVDYGQVSEASIGDTDYGSMMLTDGIPYGLFRFSGGIDELFQPVKRTFGHQSEGGFNVSGGVTNVQFGEPTPQIYIVDGNKVDLTTKHSFNVYGGESDAFSRIYAGSGSLFHIGDKVERATYSYGGRELQKDIFVQANDTQIINLSSFSNVTLLQSGTGQGSGGGFAIGQHLKFSGSGTRGFNTYPIDLRNYSEIEIDLIIGTSSNGGENADGSEDFGIAYSINGGTNFTTFVIIDSEDPTFTGTNVGTGSFTLPQAARTSNTIIRFYQLAHSGSGFDQIGITNFRFIADDGALEVINPAPQNVETSYGTVDSPVTQNEDYGSVSQASIGDTDFGSLIASDGNKFGLFKVTGSATTAPDFLNLGVYNASIEEVDYLPPGTALIRRDSLFFTGFITEKTTSSYVGAGTLFNFSGGLESVTFEYNNSSVVALGTQTSYGDLGAVTNSVDYGQVTEASIGDVDFGETVPDANINPFGLFTIAGGDEQVRTRSFVGKGNLFSAGGLVESKSNNEAESTILFNFTGRTSVKQTDDYIGSGSLFSIGDKVERATYSYNESAVLEIGNPNNYGDITTTGTSVDYGFVNEIAVGETDNGAIIDTDTIEPYGLFRISGAAATVAYQRFPWTGYAEIRFTHQPLPTDTRYVPSYDGYYEMSLVWNNSESYSKATYIGEGSLFNIGDRVERATYSYNVSSIVEIDDPNQYGNITDPVTSTVDYGSVTVVTSNQIDQGNIIILPGDENPFGKLFNITGAAVEEFFPTFAWNRPSPPIRIFKGQSKPTDQRFFPWYRSYGDITITNNVIPYARTRPFIGSGSLFNIGDKLEAVTYDYNESSVVEFVPGGSYGNITDPVTTTVDYGSVDTIASGDTDLGSIIVTDIIYPYTGLFEFQGTAESQFIRGPYVAKDGLLSITGSLVEKVSQTDDTFGSYFITGDGETPRARVFVGSGSLFNIGDKVERRAYSYNESSVATFVPGGSYGNITDPATTTVDYGSVIGSASGDTDFGSIIATDTTEPYGLFTISGQSADRWIQVFGYYGDDRDPGTSGSLFTFNGAVESITSNPPENTVLFEFGQGYSALSFGKGNYAGSGSLFNIGDRVERATYSYNESSTAFTATNINYGTASDYGDITTASTSTIDYGSVSTVTSDQVDAGGIITTTGSEYPYGLFKIAGSAIQPKKIANWVGTGELFAAKGAAEVFSAQTPEDTFLYKFTGRAVEKHVENWVGTGNIKIKEETPLAPNAAVRFRPWWRSYGEIFITGAAEEEFRGSYVGGLGVQFTLYTDKVGFEWRNYRPSPRYVNSVYGNIGGSAFTSGVSTTQKINVYGYYGDLRDPGTSGSLFGIGGGAESTSVSEIGNDENITFFTFSGTSPSKWNPAWTSRPDGSPRLSGTPELQLRFNLFGNVDPVDNFKISGTPDLKITLNYNGSGSLFSVGSASEVVGYNPDLETVLFTYGGRGTTLFSLLHVGSGSLFGIGGATESTTVQVPDSTVLFVPSGQAVQKATKEYVGDGSATFSGNLAERQTDSYLGTGSLFTANGAAESITNIKPESTVLFIASGGDNNSQTRSIVAQGNIDLADNANESTTRPYIGEGSLFSIGGATESVSVAEESTGLFNFVGRATVSRDRDFVGSGSLFGYSGSAEAVAVVPEIETNLYRFTGAAVEKQTDRYVSEGVIEFVSGIADESVTRPFIGKGSLFAVGGATESTTTNPPEDTILYRIEGRGTIKATQKHFGSGTEFVSGVAATSRARDFVGSGSLFSVGNAAESKTVVVESIQLFKATGTATEKFTRGSYNTTGSTTISGGVSDIKITRANEVFAYVSAFGTLVEKQTDNYVGSGSLFGFKNAAVARTIDINTTLPGAQPGDVVSVNLFTFTGSNPGSVTRITQPETARFKVTGDSVNVLKLFSPIRIFGTII